MNGLQLDCEELESYGIDPCALVDWAYRKQLRNLINQAFARTLQNDRMSLINGAVRLSNRKGSYVLVPYDSTITATPA